MCRPYPLETRKNVLEMYRDGVPVAEIIRQTGVSNGCMHSWIREAGLPKRRQSLKKPEPVPPVIATDISNLTLEQRKSLVDGFKASKNKAAFAMEQKFLVYCFNNHKNSTHFLRKKYALKMH